MPLNHPIITTEWLQQALHHAGALQAGRVLAVESEPVSSSWSQLQRIRVQYSPDALGECPISLLLKRCDTTSGAFGPSEVYYYQRDYLGLADAPIPRCYDAAYSDSPQAYHLLLADLSATHTACWERTPTDDYARSLADAIATLHAYRWGTAGLHALGYSVPQANDFERYLGHIQVGLTPLLALTDGQLDPAWTLRLPQIMQRVVPYYTSRASNPRGITLLHGDINPGNILAPHQGSTPLYLIDRQPFDWSLTRWLGVSDLVYAMVVWWDTPVRRNLEEPTLRRYHAALRSYGVADYPWAQLMQDYRTCIVEAIAVAVEWCVLESDRTRMRWLWEQQLQRALLAYQDLNCAEIWE